MALDPNIVAILCLVGGVVVVTCIIDRSANTRRNGATTAMHNLTFGIIVALAGLTTAAIGTVNLLLSGAWIHLAVSVALITFTCGDALGRGWMVLSREDENEDENA